MAGVSENGLNALEQFYLLLPILVSSATLIQLPSVAVFLSNNWRAIQLYDSQEVNEEEKAKYQSQKPKQSKWKTGLYTLITILVILGPEIFLFATADKKLCPTLTFVREHVVHYYLCFIGIPLLYSLIPTSNQHVFVSRTEPDLKSRVMARTIRDFKFRIPSMKFFVLALTPTVFVGLTFYLPIETLIIQTFVAILLSRGLLRQPVTFRKFSSFRGLFLGPFLYLMFCAALGTAIVAIIITGEKAVGKDETEPSSTNLAEAADSDEELERLIAAIRPYVWIVSNFIPAALISLAYRYDSANAGHSLLGNEVPQLLSEESDKKETIEVEDVSGESTSAIVLKEFDGQGKRAIQLSSVSLPRLARSQTPIFNVGMLTFLLTHIGAILLALWIPTDLTVFSQGTSTSSSSPSRVALESVFSAFPPGWASTVLVPIAMLIRAYFSKEGATKLWNYHEKWGVDTPKKIKQDVEEKVEDVKHQEGQSLLADYE